MTARSDEHPVPAIEIWFDFVSHDSCLSLMRIEAEAAKRKVAVLWRPFLLGPIFQSCGWTTAPFELQTFKGEHVRKDRPRQGHEQGPPWRAPSRLPRSALLALRVALLGAEQVWIGTFCRRMAALNFADDRDLEDPDLIAQLLSDLWLPAPRIIADAQAEPNEQALHAQTEVARAQGVFGAPGFVVDGEIFRGNDRLEDALSHCLKRSR